MQPKLLWTPTPERRDTSTLATFTEWLEGRARRSFETYEDLHRWSVENIPEFWRAVWTFSDVVHDGQITRVMSEPRMPGTIWFEGAELNFAENLLRGEPDRLAVIAETELEGMRRELTLGELRTLVSRAAAGLRALGVGQGDRVAALLPNIPECLVAMLASASIGAIWSSCSPDFGTQGVIDRFGQIAPRVLFSADGYLYRGKQHSLEGRLRDLRERLPSVEHWVRIPFSGRELRSPGGPELRSLGGQIGWEDFLGDSAEPPRFERLPFAHPLYIMYTSGTTGTPKCIVHGAGGTLLKQLEEHRLQTDVKEGDVLFYFTTCGWMMWNWLVSGLASGATIVLYDGNPMAPDERRLFRMIDRNSISHFGTSPRYLSAIEKSGLVPRDEFALDSLRAILSTGSPLHPAQFDWIYEAVKTDVHMASISGGTDLMGCFVLGAPVLPVYRGEIQARCLGMDVQSFSDDGKPLSNEKGELVCCAPFPSMPLGFWNDPDGSKYRAAYFERFPDVWHHGDFIEFTERGSAIIHGRSDATLNPGGVRIGTAEIYRQVETLPEIEDAIAVERQVNGEDFIALFVVLAEGVELGEELCQRVRTAIREGASPRHTPKEILAIPEVPRTVSGKAVELAVAQVLRGEEVTNRDALANPEALEAFRKFR